MVNFTLLLPDNLEAAPYIAADGYKWKSEDLHDETTGRTMDGVMHVSRIDTKDQLDCTCIPMCETDARALLQALRRYPEFYVTYISPEYEEPRTAVFYCPSRNADFLIHVRGVRWWHNMKFTLIEC